MKWVGVFLDEELIYGSPLNYDNAIDLYDYAKECAIETGKVHEVKIYEKN